MAIEAGLEVGPRTHTYNGDLAHEANVWARENGHGDALHREIFRAYFIRNENIGAIDVLVAMAAGIGLDGQGLRQALVERRYRDEVLAEYAESREIGVTAVPTFVAEGYAIVGAHPYDSFRRLLAAVGQVPKVVPGETSSPGEANP
jgi:predicted DsbA family dithiol-disulfide isomerase